MKLVQEHRVVAQAMLAPLALEPEDWIVNDVRMQLLEAHVSTEYLSGRHTHQATAQVAAHLLQLSSSRLDSGHTTPAHQQRRAVDARRKRERERE